MSSTPRESRGIPWLIATAGVCLLLAGVVGVRANPPSGRLDYKLPKSTTQGEPLILVARLNNVTGDRMVADLGQDDAAQFVFRATRPDGTSVRVQPNPAPADPKGTRHLIARNTSYTAAIVLDEWLSLAQVGRYQLELAFEGSVVLGSGEAAGLNRTAMFTVDVKPKNVPQLKKRCEQWLKPVMTLSPGSEARAAGIALARVADPVAVPYLEKAAARTRAALFFLALKHIGGRDARTALERLAQSTDQDVRSQAQGALAPIR